MLIEFRTGNFRSIREEQALTMEAGRGGDPADFRPRRVGGYSERLLPAVAFYGANASGKSNMLAALRFMRDAVDMSHRLWPPDEGVPRQSFAWGNKVSEPSLFEVSVLIDGVRHRYGFTCDDMRIVEEWLHVWPKGRKQTWFTRAESGLKFGELFLGESRLIEQVTRSNALFLSAAAQLGHPQATPLYQWFKALRTFNVPAASMGARKYGFPTRHGGSSWLWQTLEERSALDHQPSLFDDGETSDPRYQVFLEMLRAADIGIVDVKLEKKEKEHWPPRVLLRHQNLSDEAWLPLEEESGGTRTLFRMGPGLVDSLFSGGVLAIDELEASLHPLLALWVVRRFNDPLTNPQNAQIIFATHDTNLLGTSAGDPPLRRDQVWLTEKDREGATHLYPLTDYKPRKEENLERGYLQGRYGAIPCLGDLTGFDR
ncbi:MAG: ATP-binding protein [Magnetospirillum sp. WYHS-4]